MFVAFAVCFVWDTKPDFPSDDKWVVMWLPNPLYISFKEDNVVIPDAMMFCY